MEWYERWFREEYLIVYDHRNTWEAEREVQTIKNVLNIRGNELILDLCCGSGRHDIPLARIGCRVIGLDISEPLLKIARSSRPRSEKFPQYINADARKTPFREGVFDIVLNLFTSFGYFKDDENYELLRSIACILKPGGSFYIDYFNTPRVLANLVEESTRLYTDREENSIKIIEKRKFNPTTHRIEKTITLKRDGQSQEFRESVRLYERDEILDMLYSAGLHNEGVLGSVEGEPYSESSERMILYGSKK